MSVVENRPDSETKYPTVKEGFLWWEFGVFIFNNLFYFAARDFETPAVPLSLILVDIPPMIVFVLFFISKYIFSKSDHGDRSLRIYRNRLGLLVGCLIALIIVMPIFILEGDLNVGDMFLYPFVLVGLVVPFQIFAVAG